MKEQFALLDDTLIDRVFQPWAERISERWTLGSFRLARFFLDAAAIALILSQAAHAPGTDAFGPSLPYVYPLLVLGPGLAALSILRNEFRRTEKKSSDHRSAAANPLRLGMHWHRLVCFFWFMVLLLQTSETGLKWEGLALLAVGLFATLAVYFAACFARPVKPRVAGSWLRLPKRAVLFARRTIR
jgi:hypothetical protein